MVGKIWAVMGRCAAELLCSPRLSYVCSWGIRFAFDLRVSHFDVLLNGACNTMSHRLKELKGTPVARWTLSPDGLLKTDAESAETFLVKMTNIQLQLPWAEK